MAWTYTSSTGAIPPVMVAMSMDDYINWYMDDCVNFIRKEKKVDKVNLLGVCQGGTFLHHLFPDEPDKIKNLVTMVVLHRLPETMHCCSAGASL